MLNILLNSIACYNIYLCQVKKAKAKPAPSVTTDKEHVNVVFIGHVGKCYLCLISRDCMFANKQGRKRPLDTPKRMIKRRERERKREKERQKERYREVGRDKREREREGEKEREKGRERDREREREVKNAQSKHNPSPNAFPKLCHARV